MHVSWYMCPICGQNYTGAMELSLARELVRRLSSLPGLDRERVEAELMLANVLVGAVPGSSCAEAIALFRRVLAAKKIVQGAEHEETLNAAGMLASALAGDVRAHAEAEALHKDVITAFKCTPDDMHTLAPPHPHMSADEMANAEFRAKAIRDDWSESALVASNNYASLLSGTGRLAEAEPMLRNVLAARRRGIGETHLYTMQTAIALSNALFRMGKPVEAVDVLQQTLPVQKRVLGDTHPMTLSTSRLLGQVRTCLAVWNAVGGGGSRTKPL